MENQHRHITGYRDLNEAEIAAMNDLKQLGQAIEAALERASKTEDVDMRWLSIARTHMQQGLMAAVRSIAKPESF